MTIIIIIGVVGIFIAMVMALNEIFDDEEVKKNRAEHEKWLKDDRVFLSPGDKGYCCLADAPRDMYCNSCDKQGNIFMYKPWAGRVYKGPCDRYKASEDDVELIDCEYREVSNHRG